MTSKVPGIRTLASRISALEQVVSPAPIPAPRTTSTPTAFAEQLLTATTNSLKQDLGTILQHYEDGLKALGINLSNVSLTDLVKIVPYTITYVETNIPVIASFIKKDITSNLKLQTSVTFITQYIATEEPFLRTLIESYVDILFNEARNTLIDVLPNSTVKTAQNVPSAAPIATTKKFSLGLSRSKSVKKTSS